jgi:hypothetical protein
MNRQDWIDQWIARSKATNVDPEFIDHVMTAVATPHSKPSPLFSFLESLAEMGFRRIETFQSRPAGITTGAVGGFLRLAVFVYVLLFV